MLAGAIYVGYYAVKRLQVVGAQASQAQPGAGQVSPGVGTAAPASTAGCGPTYGGPQISAQDFSAAVLRQGGSPAEASFLGQVGQLESGGGFLGAINSCDPNGGSYGYAQVNGLWGSLIGNVQSFLGSIDQQATAALAVLRAQGPIAWSTAPQVPGVNWGLR